MKKKLVILILGCFILIGCNKTKGTIEEITGVDFNDISYIKVDQNYDYDVETFINEYKNKTYKKISTKYGNTAHLYYECYNESDKLLFTLVEVGNQNLVFIKKGEFDINKDSSKSLYQLVE